MADEADRAKLQKLADIADTNDKINENADTLVRILDIEVQRRNNIGERCFLELADQKWTNTAALSTELGKVHRETVCARNKTACKGVDRMLQEINEIGRATRATEPQRPATPRPAPGQGGLNAYLNKQEAHDTWAQKRTAGLNLRAHWLQAWAKALQLEDDIISKKMSSRHGPEDIQIRDWAKCDEEHCTWYIAGWGDGNLDPKGEETPADGHRSQID